MKKIISILIGTLILTLCSCRENDYDIAKNELVKTEINNNESASEIKSLPEMNFIGGTEDGIKEITGFCMDESLCKQDGSIGIVMKFYITRKGSTGIEIFEKILVPSSSIFIDRITFNCDELYVNSFTTGWNGHLGVIGPKESREIILNIANSKKTIITAESVNGVYEFFIDGEDFKEFAMQTN